LKYPDEKNFPNELKLLNQRIIDLEKLLAEKDLQLSDSNLLKNLLESATDSVFLHDFDGNFIYVNEATYKTWVYSENSSPVPIEIHSRIMGYENETLILSPYSETIEGITGVKE